jgi:hypothetical protein
MMKRGFQLKKIFGVALVLSGLVGCAGADTPFTLVDSNPASQSGPSTPPSSTPPAAGGGCLVTFSSKIVLKTKLAPGASSSADPTGLVTGDPHDMPPIKLHFNGNTVTMIGDEFQEGQLVLGTQTIHVRQKAGTQATGTYNSADGSINLSGVEFEITSPIDIPLPSFTLTTGDTGAVHGDFGDLDATGVPLANDKSMTFVGGFKIATFPLAEYIGAAVTVQLQGSLDSIPDPATCTGGDSASGLTLKEVINNPDHSTSESDLGSNNTLAFGRVFVPQAGVDSPGADDPHFHVTKVLRVKNQTASAVSGTFTAPTGYTITPNGNVSIAAGATQDFQIQFGMAPASDYSESNVPTSKDMNGTLSLGTTTINLAGEARRAAPEISVIGTETSAPSTIDLGISPAAVLGSGASTKLDCRSGTGTQIPVVARKVSLINSGIRPLQIQHIHSPVQTPLQTPDPLCSGYGSEFLRMGLNVEGGASCTTVSIGGHNYLTDQCQIPVGNGKVNFKVVYVPMNASSVANASGNTLEKDTANLDVDSNDTRFTDTSGANPFRLNLLGGVSPDRSNVLKIQKDGSTVEIPAGGNLRINIPNMTDDSVMQKFVLLNHLDQPLNNVQITMADTAHFQVMNTPSPAPTTIPPMSSGVGAEPGRGEFYVRFTKPSGVTSGNFPTTLQVKFVPDSSGVQNTFTVNLTGTVNHQVIQGEADMTIEFLSSYINTPLLGSSPLDSLDYRQSQFAPFRPGAMRMQFDPISGSDTKRSVTIINSPGLEPTAPNILNNLRALGKSERAKLVRVYSTRLSGYPGGVEDGNHDGIPDCTDPESINEDYQTGRCSFFYYLFATKPGNPGTYDDETGELIFPDIDLRLLNPFHATVLDYLSTEATNTTLKATVSTLTVDSKFDGDVSLVPEPSLNTSDLPVPDTAAQAIFASPEFQCPEGDAWKPTDPVKPAFGCYIDHSSPHYIKGLSLTPLPDGDYMMILTLVSRFSSAGPPEYVPSFMAGGELWVAIQGRLHVCGAMGCAP